MTVRLDGIDLVIFDKDGTLIEFHAMWSGWAIALADDLRIATGRVVQGAAVRDARLRRRDRVRPCPTADLRRPRCHGSAIGRGASSSTTGLTPDQADRALDDRLARSGPGRAWRRPLADLGALFERLHRDGRKVAVATSDDRDPTVRTLAALGIAGAIDAVVCADDGVAVKPAPDMVRWLCAATGVRVDRAAVVGDSPADLRMGRAAGADLTIGVLTGVGSRADLEPLADSIIDSVAAFIDD